MCLQFLSKFIFLTIITDYLQVQYIISIYCFDYNADEFFSEHRRVLEQRLAPLVREVTDARGKSREELESLYRKIVSVVLLRSGLGAPTDIGVVREATGSELRFGFS